ncbi:MAG: hypothetical protein COB02_13915 [Candidatus Cloacimonadota bacterium]|nr:MAG: hypothetical protein COB02_13915 [Candidatus Cloacimonadota bacterium]
MKHKTLLAITFILTTSTFIAGTNHKEKSLSDKELKKRYEMPAIIREDCWSSPMSSTQINKMIKNIYSFTYNGKPRTPFPIEIDSIKVLLGQNKNNKKFVKQLNKCKPIGRAKYQLSLVLKNHNFENYWNEKDKKGLIDLAFIKSFTPSNDRQISKLITTKFSKEWNRIKKDQKKFQHFIDERISLTNKMKNPRDKYMVQKMIYSILNKLDIQLKGELPNNLYDFTRKRKYRVKMMKEISLFKKKQLKKK